MFYVFVLFSSLFPLIITGQILQGAVESLMERSAFIQLLDGSVVKLDEYSRDLILQSLHEMSTSALRCLGFAYRDDLAEFASYNGDEDHPAHQLLLNPANYSSIESQLIFVGLVGLKVSFSLFICPLFSCCKPFYFYPFCRNY